MDEFSLFSQSLNEVELIPLTPSIPVTFGVLYNSYNSLPKPAEEFIEILKELIN